MFSSFAAAAFSSLMPPLAPLPRPPLLPRPRLAGVTDEAASASAVSSVETNDFASAAKVVVGVDGMEEEEEGCAIGLPLP